MHRDAKAQRPGRQTKMEFAMSDNNRILWTDSTQTRYFLIPDGESLPASELVIRTFAGATRRSRTSLLHRAMLPLPAQRIFGTVRAVLPNDGVLLGVPETGEIVWMGADGANEGRLALAGLGRSDGGLVLGTEEGDTLTLTKTSIYARGVHCHADNSA